jgi:hypothetical protein
MLRSDPALQSEKLDWRWKEDINEASMLNIIPSLEPIDSCESDQMITGRIERPDSPAEKEE